MPSTSPRATAKPSSGRSGSSSMVLPAALLLATMAAATGPTLAETAGSSSPGSSSPGTSTAGGGQTPTQPTANDPSVGLPSQPATMTKNPEAMSPHAARVDGTAPVKPEAK